ncbi:MAG: transcriptional regulator of acetoin/glycerol metabolism [Paracoccaceae bacterium]
MKHGLDPDECRAPERIEQSALRHCCAAFEKFMTVATPRLDALISLVGQSGRAVFLTDSDGVVQNQRMPDADAPALETWNLSIGADWSEEREGTNDRHLADRTSPRYHPSGRTFLCPQHRCELH